MEHVLELRPDICSLDVATMNFGGHAFVNIPDHIERIARAVRAAGVKPELEVFDLGHARSRGTCSSRGCSPIRRCSSSASAFRGGLPPPPKRWWP